MGRADVTTLLFLPSGDRPYRWMTLADDRVAGEGEGLPAIDVEEPVIAVAPADAVTLHWAELPDRSAAQAVAAARLVVAEASATPLGELHVAVGDEGDANRPIGVVAAGSMREWLAGLARSGVDPVAMIPAPMLLPRPQDGYIRARPAGEGVVRGPAMGFADEARLTELVTGGVEPEDLDRDALTRALLASAAMPSLDLRQGMFARRRRIGIDWALVRRLAALAGTILLVTLAIDLVRIAKYSFGADAVAARADALGATGLPRGETVTDIDRQLDERVSAVRGPGVGFTTTAAAVYATVRTVPGVELTGIDFSPNGSMRLSVTAERESLPTDLKRALERAGFDVTASTFTSAGGRVTGEMTVTRS
jgi:general secretion pathway protein L